MDDTISVIVTQNDTKSIFGSGAARQAEIPIDRLRASLSDLVSKLKVATSDLIAKSEGFSLKELEVGVELTAEGGVSLIGTAKVGGSASLKLTFVHD
jgi:hypothetical protein